MKKHTLEKKNQLRRFNPVALRLLVILVVLVIAALLQFGARTRATASVCVRTQVAAQDDMCAISLEKVDTEALREKGLSGRSALGKNQGMLFVFDRIDNECIWMKDMRFPIDILWLDAQNNVSKVMENVSPSTYPHEFCQDGTRYVIELVAGAAKTSRFILGSHINL